MLNCHELPKPWLWPSHRPWRRRSHSHMFFNVQSDQVFAVSKSAPGFQTLRRSKVHSFCTAHISSFKDLQRAKLVLCIASGWPGKKMQQQAQCLKTHKGARCQTQKKKHFDKALWEAWESKQNFWQKLSIVNSWKARNHSGKECALRQPAVFASKRYSFGTPRSWYRLWSPRRTPLSKPGAPLSSEAPPMQKCQQATATTIGIIGTNKNSTNQPTNKQTNKQTNMLNCIQLSTQWNEIPGLKSSLN